jgi:hypothetical protein
MTTYRRRSLGVALVLAALALPWTPGLGACSSSDSGGGAAGSPRFLEDASATFDTATVPFDGGSTPTEDALPVIFGDDANGGQADGALSSACSGSTLPATTTGACAIDTSESCPTCASWGFVCSSFASPQMQPGVSPSSFCRATATEAGALVCCTQPACVVTTVAGGCDASAQTRYDCSGGAVPTGTCQWLGAGAPNDYCCQ